MTGRTDSHPLADTALPFLRRVKVRNYKSIESCAVDLGPLTVLVGKNGSGKSNFLDALRFLTDCLQTSLDHAIRDRGGIDAVRRRSTGHPRNFAIEIELHLPEKPYLGSYGFEIAPRKDGGFLVKQEQLVIHLAGSPHRRVAGFRREDSKLVAASIDKPPPVQHDRLYLANVAGFPYFLDTFNALQAVGFYNLNPDRMKELQSPDAGDLLHRDGSNVASVIGRLKRVRPEIMKRITTYLQAIVPGVTEVERVALGPGETLQFRQQVEAAKHPLKFYAASMSDGTLRALGSLVAVTQLVDRKLPVHLVGIEEPETALHPAAAGALMDALREAAASTQILVTTHSPDLCNLVDPEQERLLVVASAEGVTRIAQADPASLEAIRQHLYPPGELLRMDQLEPDAEEVEAQKQLYLCEDSVEAA
jgi:predicted ATPase